MTRSLIRSHRSLVACTLILTLAAAALAPNAQAAPGASIGGRVFTQTGSTPLSGATVHLVGNETRQVVGSALTDASGSFRIENAPTGDYRVLVETDQGAFVSPAAMALAPGNNTPVSVTIGGGRNEAKRDYGFGNAANPGLPRWGKWVIAGSAAVAGLFLINEISDEEQSASAF